MASSMGGLPSEINIHILAYLDYRSQTNLRACNWYYRSLPAPSDENIYLLLLELEMSSAKANPKHLFVNGFLPCYTCFQMRPRALFCSDYLQSQWRAAGQSNAILRVCQQCSPGHGDRHLVRSGGSKKRCPCAKKVEVILTGKALPPVQLLDLPLKIHNRIRKLLDAKSLARLRATSTYFRNKISVRDVERRLCHEAVQLGPCVSPRVCACHLLCTLCENFVNRAFWRANRPSRAYLS
ncbi:hypothetical protein GJ744_002271 [Endocarpon pusillum]|uniref:F-box domain-containing protein n=1 Tax=Endocarpon pusillum TaxID=364733 RepID=A0A8H7A838_9EURO|nr:hypothetical protein GJ744_002271 [Endocarpon pusillum]